MNEKNYTYNVETYSLLTHADDSLLLLNHVLEPFGYRFICIPLDELERDFSNLFQLKKPYEPIGTAEIGWLNKTVSTRFFETVERQSQFGSGLLYSGYVVVLKRINDYQRMVIDSKVEFDESFEAIHIMHEFTRAVVHYLRLIKNCLIDCMLQFHISRPQGEVVARYEGFCKKPFGKAIVNLTVQDVDRFARQFSEKMDINNISRVGYDAFTLAHDIIDPGLEFITLMTALESIFNTTGDQISHTVSRHVAVIFSSNRDDFSFHYKKMKRLYSIRSKLVHGAYPKDKWEAELGNLKTYAREALIFSLQYQRSKDCLFDYLNATGFPK